MIKIEVDEAYAFDMLAIMELKAEYSGTEQNNAIATEFFKVIKGVLGENLAYNIKISEEYRNLLEANREAYLLIDQIVAGAQIGAEQVHHANMERHHWKGQLQQHFFGQDLTEQKTV